MNQKEARMTLSCFFSFPESREESARKAWELIKSGFPGEEGEMEMIAIPETAIDSVSSSDLGCAFYQREGLSLIGFFFSDDRKPERPEKKEDQGKSASGAIDAPREDMLNVQSMLTAVLRHVEDTCKNALCTSIVITSSSAAKSEIFPMESVIIVAKNGKERNASELIPKPHAYQLAPSSEKYGRDIHLSVAVADGTYYILETLLSGAENYYKEIMEERDYLERETLRAFRIPPRGTPGYLDELEGRVRSLSEKHVKLSLNATVIKERIETIKYRMINVEVFGELLKNSSEIFTAIPLIRDEKVAKMRVALLEKGVKSLELSLSNARTAIGSIRMDVELHRSAEASRLQSEIKVAQEMTVKLQGDLKDLHRTTLELQKEGVVLQTAAAFIEFILIFYYSLGAWHYISPGSVESALPSFLFFFGLIMGISLTAAGHFLTISLKEKRLDKNFITSILIAIILVLMAAFGQYPKKTDGTSSHGAQQTTIQITQPATFHISCSVQPRRKSSDHCIL